jgi:hypothetical protein
MANTPYYTKAETEAKLNSNLSRAIQGEYISYTTLADAQAVNPKPSDGTLFQVEEEANKGVYTFQSGEAGGTKFRTKALEDVLEDKGVYKINKSLVIGKNLYNKEWNTNGFRVNQTNGTLLANASYSTSDFIEIKPSTTYTITYTIYHAWYDENKAFISGSSTATKTLNSPANAKYLRHSWTTSALETTQLEEGSVETAYEPFKILIPSDQVKGLDTQIANSIQEEGYIKPIVGKNLFNQSKSTLDFRVSPSTGTLVSATGNQTSEYIEVKPNTDYAFTSLTFAAWYDSSYKFINEQIPTNPVVVTSPTNAKYVRFSTSYPVAKAQFEESSERTEYEPYQYRFKYTDTQHEPIKNTITVNRDISSGADFTGNRAIQDAIESITDASEYNQYILKCTGVFEATQLSDFDVLEAENNFIVGKSFIHLEGVKEFKIIGTLPTDNQTVSVVRWNADKSTISNCEIIAKNVRYAMHIEGSGTFNKNYKRTFKNVTFKYDGLIVPVGFGTSTGEEQYFEDCSFYGNKGTFYFHTNQDFEKPNIVSLKRCLMYSQGSESTAIQMMGTGQKDKAIFEDCIFNNGSFAYNDTNFRNDYSDNPNHAECNVSIKSTYPLAVNNSFSNTCLKITSKSTGSGSSVRLDSNSDAFNLIIGNSSKVSETENEFFRKSLNGYEFKDGSDILSGFALSGIDINEISGKVIYRTSLGKRLGDCSTVNKTLTVIIDGVSYDVIFNKNYNGTSETTAPNYTNAQIIAEIEAVIGSVADVKMYNYGIDYYPEFKGVKIVTNADTGAILKGMGVVYNGLNSIRKATNSDNRVDGVALYDMTIGGKGKIIEKGQLYTTNASKRFSILEIDNVRREIGEELGISTTQPGYFDLNASPKLTKVIDANIVKI